MKSSSKWSMVGVVILAIIGAGALAGEDSYQDGRPHGAPCRRALRASSVSRCAVVLAAERPARRRCAQVEHEIVLEDRHGNRTVLTPADLGPYDLPAGLEAVPMLASDSGAAGLGLPSDSEPRV